MAQNFFASCMASEDVRSLRYSGVFYSGTATAAVNDGALVVRGDMLNHTLYTTLKDPNMYKITAPTADTAAVHVVDYAGVSQGTINGVVYRDGIKTFGLAAPAGTPVRVRIPKKWDTCYFAAGNFASTPVVGEYAVPTANATTWTPAASAATTKTCVKIEFDKDVTEGTALNGKEYFVTFINVVE